MKHDVYFIYLGQRLPKYAWPSIELAQRHSGLNVHLISDIRAIPAHPDNTFDVVDVRDFYKPQEFEKFADKISSSHSFRSGFWLRTLERFFVMEQLMIDRSLPNILHAELDQLLFNAGDLASNLDKSEKRGMFLPFHDSNSAVASIFFCNDVSSIRGLIDFGFSSTDVENEMSLIARFANSTTSRVHALPTISSETKPEVTTRLTSITPIPAERLGGVVDAAQIGQWVAGIDPRNVPPTKAPVTKFVDQPNPMLLNREELEDTHFTLSSDSTLSVSVGDKALFRLFNLHIHSKIHGHLWRQDPTLQRLVRYANSSSEEKIPGTRAMQLTDFLQTAIRRFFSLTFSLLRLPARKKN